MHINYNTTKTTIRNDKKQSHKQQNMRGDLLRISNHAKKISYLLYRNVSQESI